MEMNTVKKRAKLTKEQIETIREMSEHRHTQFDIAEKVGCSIETIRRYQQKFELPASNRQEASGRGKVVKMVIPQPVKVVEEPKKVESKEDGRWTSIENAAIRISGKKTGFVYSIGFSCKDVCIETGYSDEVKIDIKDLAAFGNELLDIAEKLTEMKKSMMEL